MNDTPIITPDKKTTRSFYNVLANSILANVTNMTVWFGITFYIYLQTRAVIATAILSGIYLVAVSVTGFWLGSIVDHNKKKKVMLVSSFISLAVFTVGFIIYLLVPHSEFASVSSVTLWVFVVLLMVGVIAGNVRFIAIPTLVTFMIPEDQRDRANGLVGTAGGIAFLIVSVISGILVGHSGMYLVLLLSVLVTIGAIVHLWFTNIPEPGIKHLAHDATAEEIAAHGKIDLRGTLKVVRAIPGLFSLILFTTFNNFLGGVFMSLMDAYGLSLVSVQTWGFLWGIISTAFIIGGIIIAKWGLGKNPLRSMFIANIIIWTISTFFTIQPWILLLAVGMFIYLAVVPFIQAAELTIMQKVVPAERQGRVFGFAQSVEQSASPLTAFLIGPIAQFIFIPFMTTGAGVQLIGNWFGVGPDRGIALVFTLTGVIGLAATLLVMRSRFYKQLSDIYTK